MKRNFNKSIIGIFVLAIILGSVPLYGDTTRVKSYIGNGDIKWWDGVNTTFTRRTSTGGLLTLNAVGAFVDVAEVYGNGSASWAALSTAISTISSNNRALYLKPGTWDLAANLTVPTNVTLIAVPGTILQVGNGSTLTINGGVQAGIHQIFSCVGTGAVVFGDGYVTTLYPEWWGTNETALQACLTASSKKTIHFAKRDWTVTTGLTGASLTGTKLIGEIGARIVLTTAAARALTLTDCNDIVIQDLSFYGPDGTSTEAVVPATPWTPDNFNATEAGIYIDGTSGTIIVENCKFEKFADVAICGYSATKMVVDNNEIIGHALPTTNPTAGKDLYYCVGVWCRNGQLIATRNKVTLISYGFVLENYLGDTNTQSHVISNNRVEFTDYASAGIYANASYDGKFVNNQFIAPATAYIHEGTIKIRTGTENRVSGNFIKNGFMRLSSTHNLIISDNSIHDLLNTIQPNPWPAIFMSYEDGSSPHHININNNFITGIANQSGIELSVACYAINVTNNSIALCGTSGININNAIASDVTKINISGNNIYDCVVQIKLAGALGRFGNVNITNNIVYKSSGTATHGIYIAPGAGSAFICKMYGNQVWGHTTANYDVAISSRVENLITNEIVQTITDNDQVLVAGIETTNFTNTGAVDDAYTLADGHFEGQRKIVRAVSITGAGDVVITPTTFESATITLNAANQSVELMWTGSAWRVVVNNGATIA